MCTFRSLLKNRHQLSIVWKWIKICFVIHHRQLSPRGSKNIKTFSLHHSQLNLLYQTKSDFIALPRRFIWKNYKHRRVRNVVEHDEIKGKTCDKRNVMEPKLQRVFKIDEHNLRTFEVSLIYDVHSMMNFSRLVAAVKENQLWVDSEAWENGN